MHANPCGMAVDWGHDPHTVKARVHKGDNVPIVKLQWYVTVLPFLTGEVEINNRIFDDDKDVDRPLGELPVKRNAYKFGGRSTPIPGLTGNHICHREWMIGGEPWPNDLPDQEYDQYEIPTCCGAFHDPGIFGVEIGGEMGDKVGYKNPTSGGLMIGGEMGDQFHVGDAAAGGLELGGAAGDLIEFRDGAAGGLQLGGAAGDVLSGTDSAEGGVEIGGEAGDVFDGTDEAEGGLEIGGEMGDRYYHASPAAGGVEIGGQAGDAQRYTDAASGGVEIGGAMGDVWTPPTPVPGHSCATAGALPQGVTYTGGTPGFFTADWWTFTAPVSGTLHVTVTFAGGGTGLPGIFEGGSCPSPNPVFLTVSGPPTWKWVATAGDQCWVDLSGNATGTYSITWDVG